MLTNIRMRPILWSNVYTLVSKMYINPVKSGIRKRKLWGRHWLGELSLVLD